MTRGRRDPGTRRHGDTETRGRGDQMQAISVEEGKMVSIRHFRELDVYQLAMKTSMMLFELSKSFPLEKRYSLTDQVRRSSRSVCANIAEAWRKRRYPNSFISKLSDAEAEAAETQVWIEFSVKSGYLDANDADKLDKQYESIQGKIIQMLSHPDQWCIR
jgi:four helix bundle protein